MVKKGLILWLPHLSASLAWRSGSRLRAGKLAGGHLSREADKQKLQWSFCRPKRPRSGQQRFAMRGKKFPAKANDCYARW